MASYIRFLTVFSAIFIISGAVPATAADAFTAEQKAQLEQLMEQYLLNNGEIILQSVDNFRTQEEAQMEAKAEVTIQENLKVLASADAPDTGNPDGDITVIEFFDYNCGYCKRAVPDIQALIKEDKNVRFVFREMPILGPTSLTAAQWAVAAHKQDKYFEFHAAVMKHAGQKTESEMVKIAENLGLDVEQMKKDANSETVKKQIETDMELARMIGINGTPAFIIDGKLFPGYLGPDGLKSAIESAREKSDKQDG